MIEIIVEFAFSKYLEVIFLIKEIGDMIILKDQKFSLTQVTVHFRVIGTNLYQKYPELTKITVSGALLKYLRVILLYI